MVFNKKLLFSPKIGEYLRKFFIITSTPETLPYLAQVFDKVFLREEFVENIVLFYHVCYSRAFSMFSVFFPPIFFVLTKLFDILILTELCGRIV
jgi:hypothetical protein